MLQSATVYALRFPWTSSLAFAAKSCNVNQLAGQVLSENDASSAVS